SRCCTRIPPCSFSCAEIRATVRVRSWLAWRSSAPRICARSRVAHFWKASVSSTETSPFACLRGSAERFKALLDDPRAAQEACLRTLLSRARGCEYGRRYRFDKIASYAEFCRRVPIVGYDELRSDIVRMAGGEAGVLVADPV